MFLGETKSTVTTSRPQTNSAQAEDLGTTENGLISESSSAKEAVVLKTNNDPPDGGYGWVIVACTFMLSGRLF